MFWLWDLQFIDPVLVCCIIPRHGIKLVAGTRKLKWLIVTVHL